MATLTASAAASGFQPRAVHAGLNSVTVSYNSSSTAFSNSATTVLMCKIPAGATIVDINEYHSTGADSSPTDIGIDGTLSAFATAGTQGQVNRASLGIPYTVSITDAATTRYQTVRATTTVGTATASVKISLTVFYTMDA